MHPAAPPEQFDAPVDLRGLLACLVLVSALGALDQTVVATALPAVVADLGSVARTGWVVTAYVLTMTVAMPVLGSIGDRVGRVRLLRSCIALFVVASAVCGLAGSLEQLALARAVQGIGGAGMLVLPQALVADAVPARDRAAVLGPLGAVYAVATVVGPLLGGWLTDIASWRWVFWVNLPLGVAALTLSLLVLRGPRPAARTAARFDLPGALLLATTTAGLAAAATAVPARGWTSGTLALSAGAAISAIALVARERHAAHPLLPVRVLAGRTVLLCCVLAAVVGTGMFGMIAYVPSWVQGVHGTSASHSGLLLLPVTAGIVLGLNATGRAVRRWGHWRAYPVAGCAAAAGAAAVLSVVGDTLALPAVAAVLVVFGLGTGSFMQIVVVVAQDAGPRAALGAVTSSLAYVRESGVTLGAGLLGGLLGHRLAGIPASGPLRPAAYAEAFAPLFAVVTIVFVLGFVAALLLPGRTLGGGSGE